MVQNLGLYHPLEQILSGLNTQYFENTIKATIAWGINREVPKKRKTIRLGSYHRQRQLITLHPSLDKALVPRFCVEYVIYHEMLHQKHPPIIKNNKVYNHTKAFKEEEQKYLYYKEAQSWLRANLFVLL